MKKIILSTAILALVFVGCKKDEVKPTDSTSSSSSSAKILKEIEYYLDEQGNIQDSSVTTYTYDAEGRSISQLDKSKSFFSTSNISYNVSTVVVNSSYTFKSNYASKDTTVIYNGVGFLDSKGVLIKQYEVGKKDTTSYFYTQDGFLKGNKNENIIEVSDGNIVKQVEYYTNPNTISSSSTYTYYLDKLNTIGNYNKGIYVIGKDSKNLVKTEKIIETDTDGGVSTEESTYTYEFDSKNRVIKSTRTSTSSNNTGKPYVNVTKYQYTN